MPKKRNPRRRGIRSAPARRRGAKTRRLRRKTVLRPRRRRPAARRPASRAPRRRGKLRKRRATVVRRPRAEQASRVAFQTNRQHEIFNELRALLIKASPASFPEMEKNLRRLGRIRLALITGAFLNVPDTRVDLLIVGDNVRLQRLFHFIREQEADLGKELRYVILEREEFLYRYEMFDRFLRDILDSPHYKLINTLRI